MIHQELRPPASERPLHTLDLFFRAATSTGHFLLEGLVASGCAAVGDGTGPPALRAALAERRLIGSEAVRGTAMLEALLARAALR